MTRVPVSRSTTSTSVSGGGRTTDRTLRFPITGLFAYGAPSDIPTPSSIGQPVVFSQFLNRSSEKGDEPAQQILRLERFAVFIPSAARIPTYTVEGPPAKSVTLCLESCARTMSGLYWRTITCVAPMYSGWITP